MVRRADSKKKKREGFLLEKGKRLHRGGYSKLTEIEKSQTKEDLFFTSILRREKENQFTRKRKKRRNFRGGAANQKSTKEKTGREVQARCERWVLMAKFRKAIFEEGPQSSKKRERD